MKHELILHKIDGSRLNLYNRNATSLSTVTSGEQRQTLNSDDIVMITVESAVKITFDIGDRLNVFGRWYKINRLPTVKKTGNRLFTYNIELEGVQYDLARVVYDLTIDTTSNALQDVQADMLTGNLQRFATVLIANANRVFPGKWVLGDFPAGTEDKTLVFGETDNCLLVLQRLCSEYNTEFEIIQAGDVNTLHFRKAGQIYPYTFEYGKGKGLYSLERLNVSTSNIVTRLKVYGGTRNITAKYRAARLCLPGKTKGQSYIQKTGPANNYGIWEATKIFEHIYPKRTGTVTAIDSGNVLKLTDSTMNFDLNEKEADGITTKYLIDGSPAKIHFNTGNLSGYEFEIQSYDHATKTFTLKPFEDERGERFPSEKSSAFKFAVNDKYVLLDIALPQSYIDDAEEQLAEEGGIYYDQNSQPKVQYSLEVAEEFLKELSGAGSITNIFSVGDYIPIKDADIDVDKSVRIQSFTRDLLNPFSYKLNISDTVTTTITNRVISELIEIDKITKINDIKSQVKARRDWRSAQELLDMVFDTEGDYYSEKIKPNSIETSMLAVGAKSTQFGLVGTVIQANYNGNKNSVNVKGGTLSHYAIEESGRNWTLADGTTTLTGDSTPYYIYAKCQKVGTAGSIIFSTSKITVDEDPSFYHFFVGIVNSVDPELNVRSVALTYGFTTVNGKFIRTGRIQSNDGNTYFDLDTGEIGGKITFRSTAGTDEDLAEILDGTAQDIQDAQAAANAAALLAQQAIDNAEANVTLINQETAKLQAQIDGEVSNWFYPYSPTLANYPASEWTTNEIKDRHIGDTFTNTQTFVDNETTPDAGKSWRFVKNGSTYSWTVIADSDAVLALQKAAQAQSTADGKSTTFLVQPSNYSVGDMWVLNADRTVNGTAYKQGEILTATQDSATFVEAHWLKRVRYTDDSAVENLQIGGVNLLELNSIKWEQGGISSTGTGSGDQPSYVRIRHKEYFPCVSSFDYTVKKHSSLGKILIVFYDENKDRIINRGWFTTEGVITSPSNAAYFRAVLAFEDDSNITLSALPSLKFKLEKGNKATDWSPAPEDVQAEITAAKQEALDASNSVQANVNSLNTYVDGAFKDGVIDEAEAKAIEKYLNTINETMAKAEASYNKVYANTYLEGDPKTALLNAKINLWGQRDTLISAINTAISGGTTTPAQKTAVDNAFTSFNSLMSAFQSALEEANKAIQKKLDDISKGYVDNLEIGGRNLLVGSKNYTLSNPIFSGSTATDSGMDENFWILTLGTAYLQINIPSKVAIGEKFTFSFIHTRRSLSEQNFQVSYGAENKTFTSNSNTTKSSFTFTKTADTYLRISRVEGGSGWTLRMDELQLEMGDKATSYSEATEDIQARIDKTKLTAEQAQLQAEGFMRARYIRDWLKGNTDHNTNNWSEIKVVNKAGVNLALGKIPTANGTFHANYPAVNITDGNTATQGYISQTSPTENYVQIDLGQIHYDIDYIQVWHAGWPTRLYYGTKTEISEDGVNWTTIFDSAIEGTYTETADGKIHTQRYASVISKLNQSKAITDKFKTTINGGLINTVMMLLRDLNSVIETAGISGIQGELRNNPAFWAGGTYEQAIGLIEFLHHMSEGTPPGTGEGQFDYQAKYQQLAPVAILHNGAAKVGDFLVLESGRIAMIDPSTGIPRLVFSVTDLPLIEDLISEIEDTGTVSNDSQNNVRGSYIFPNGINIEKNDSRLRFVLNWNSYLYVDGGDWGADGMVSFVLLRNGVYYDLISEFYALADPYETASEQLYTVKDFESLPAGYYTVQATVQDLSGMDAVWADIGSSQLTYYFKLQGVRRQQYGRDGMMFFYSNRHFHFTEGKGLDAKELDPKAWNTPGVLLSATILANGGWNRVWGAKQSPTPPPAPSPTGRYTIYHTIGHTNYQVNCISHTENRSFRVYAKNTNSVVVECRTIGSSPTLSNAMFDITLTGNNY